MSPELVLSFIAFAIAAQISPGPNNALLMASGVNYGVKRTLPHIAGGVSGFCVMIMLAGLGAEAVFERWPSLFGLLNGLGIAYLLFLAWRIARAEPTMPGEVRNGSPLTFLQAAAFQWVNPKAWIFAIGAVGAYAALADFPMNVIVMVGLIGFTGLAVSMLWTMFGQMLGRFLAPPRSMRIFNISMALVLLMSLVPHIARVWQ